MDLLFFITRKRTLLLFTMLFVIIWIGLAIKNSQGRNELRQLQTLEEYGSPQNISSEEDAKCNCKSVHWPYKRIYDEEKKRNVEGMNMNVLEHLTKHHPNFPFSMMTALTDDICELLPLPHEVMWSNRYWQEAYVFGTSFLLYSAFIDNRPLNKERPTVLILAMARRVSSDIPWCYLWFNTSGPPVITKGDVGGLHGGEGRLHEMFAYLLTCRVPPAEAHRKPIAVSVVESPCSKAYTLLEVIGELERNQETAYRDAFSSADGNSGLSVAACGTGLFYYQNDYSIRLVEWLEIMRAIGYSKVILHKKDVHPNISKVLRYYEEDGLLDVTFYHLPYPLMTEPSLAKLWNGIEHGHQFLSEALMFTDCVLRHMHEYRFIGHVDPDEIPVMFKHDSYISWFDSVLKEKYDLLFAKNKTLPAAYSLRWRYHVSDVQPSDEVKDLPEYMWFLRHSKVPSKWVQGHSTNGKCLYDMDVVTTVGSHFPSLCLQGQCPYTHDVHQDEGYLGHFNEYYKCGDQCQEPGGTEEIRFFLPYKDQVEKAVTNTLLNLQLI